MLYPLKFKPRFKERIWGGRLLAEKLGKKLPAGRPVGESWEIADVGRDVSVVASGPLAGNDIEELTEVYMGELVGDKVFERFGLQFPLLIKYIDAEEPLSVQVHPDDELAAGRHGSFGKTEMWYVVDCEPDAELGLGLREGVTREEYLRRAEEGTLPEILVRRKAHPGDAFFVPAGTVHYIGKGMLVAEIQQTSDATYRIYDWGRADSDGQPRELHLAEAAEAVRFEQDAPLEVTAAPRVNEAVRLIRCPYFTTNLIELDGSMERGYVELDSMVVYMVTEGSVSIGWRDGSETAGLGQTVLLPACIEHVTLSGRAKLLEIYID